MRSARLSVLSVVALALVFILPAQSAAADVLQRFEGAANTDNERFGLSFHPPDNALAVGPNHIVQMVNGVGRVTDRFGNVISLFPLADFFQVPPGIQLSDPRLVYDPSSARWFAVVTTFSESIGASSLVLAVSSTNDPTGRFCRYHLGSPASEKFLQDYPFLGMSDDKVVVSYSAYDFATNVSLGSGFYVLNKAQLVACAAPINLARAAPQPGLGKPALALSRTTTAYLATHSDVAAAVWTIDGLPGVAPVTVAGRAIALTNGWVPPPNAMQAGSSRLLDIDSRSQSVVWRNGSLWLAGNGSCMFSGDSAVRSCLRAVELRTDTMSLRQDIVFGAPGTYYFNPGTVVDGNGTLFVVFQRSAATEFLSVRATARLATDPPNTLQPSVLLRAGEANADASVDLDDGVDRIGDYSAASLDPVDRSRVWVSSEYIQGSGDWGTVLAAVQSLPSFTLTVTKSGTGRGTITSSPAGISCGGTCAMAVASGTRVTLTATADSSSTFTGWSGGGCSGVRTCVVTVNAAQTVIATFTLKTFALTVTKTGTGAGTVTTSPAGINCGSSCSASYAANASVTLTASAASGSVFAGWAGACSGTGTCTVSMTAAKSVTATFNKPTFVLSVTKTGTGTGTVTSSPAAINCGTSCSASFASPTSVKLTPSAASGSVFAGWSGACSGTSACTVSMTAAKSVTATFRRR